MIVTRTVSKILTTAATLCFCVSLGLFSADWRGHSLPEWASDMRWILFDCGAVTVIIVAINAHIMSNKEAFRIGVKVGQAPPQNVHVPWDTDEDKPQNSDTGPQKTRGFS